MIYSNYLWAIPNHKFKLAMLMMGGLFIAQPVAYAQVGFIADLVQVNLCIAQNWDTPAWQKQLQHLSQSERMQLYSGLRLSAHDKRCLMQHKPTPVALCNKVIGLSAQREPLHGGGMPFLGRLTEVEKKQLNRSEFEISPYTACLQQSTADDWVPDDLKPSQAALSILKRAQGGDVTAQLAAAGIYNTGDGIVPNAAKATLWLEKAADNGDASAQLSLGNAYLHGQFKKPVDYQQAAHWLSKAVNAADTNIATEAMLALADLYSRDPGGDDKPDWHAARRWLEKAAENGSARAMYELAQYYAQDNEAFVQNKPQAIAWYRKSAQLGHAPSMLALADDLDHTTSPRDPLAAQQWRRKADALGENGGTLNLYGYFPRASMPNNASESIEIQQQYAQQGDVDAQLALACRYFYGQDVKKNDGNALKWWRKAAQQSDAIGQRMLGLSFIHGWGIPANYEQGRLYLEKSAAQGDAVAAFELANGYYSGSLMTGNTQMQEKLRNPQLGLQWLKTAAEYGYKPEETRERIQEWTSTLIELNSQQNALEEN